MRDRNQSLDGVRALACLAVIGFHTSTPWFRGGWLGVDVFFVLSGWLITGLLLEEQQQTGSLALGRFYVRRAARLYPALIAAIGLALLLDPGLAAVKNGAVAFAYLVDVARWQDHDSMGNLGHTWSLAIEEHFYLLWPLVVIAGRNRRRIGAAAVAGSLLSLGTLMVYAPPGRVFDASSYYAPQARMWELLMGCALATVSLPRLDRRVCLGLGCLSLLVLVLAAYTPGFDSWQVLAVCGATVGLLIALQGPSVLRSLLECRPLPALGRISYGAYLYHYPIVLGVASLPGRRFLHAAVVFAATTLVAAASYRWLELPARRAVIARASRHQLVSHPTRVPRPQGRQGHMGQGQVAGEVAGEV